MHTTPFGATKLASALLGSKLLRSAALVVGLALGSLGCSKQYIPNTDVEDSEFNRNVVQFCEEYRRAVERRNIALLLKMADPKYYEDGANIDASDDLDYAGLRDYFEQKFRYTKAIRYEVRYRAVGKGRNDVINVDFTYSASYKIPTEHGDIWRRRVADNRIELAAYRDGFRILSGM
jgi:hypothetical protein